ncbi:MAG: hypothetical protein WDN46_08780 [Methylocella sp.]
MPNSTVPAADTGLPNLNHQSKDQKPSMSESAAPGRQWPDYIDAELAIDRTQSLMLIGGLAARSLETTFGGEREAMEELFTMALDQITTVKTWFHAFVPEAKREGL